MTLNKYLAAATLSFLALTTVSQAGEIKVINENKKTLGIKIEAEGDSNAVSKQEISAEHQSSFRVTKTQLNGKSYFSIKGDTSAFTSGGRCEHLSVEKDYTVTFQDDKVGTTCIAEEIKKS